MNKITCIRYEHMPKKKKKKNEKNYLYSIEQYAKKRKMKETISIR